MSNTLIYLASQSPRRSELLHQIGVKFEVLITSQYTIEQVNEDVHLNEEPLAYVTRVTKEKAHLARRVVLENNLPHYPILVADTTVVIDGTVLGKPHNVEEAKHFLNLLSGHTHRVITHVGLFHHSEYSTITQTSFVTFAHLNWQMIDRYIASKDPFDKAGGYGIQSGAAVFIQHISGSYSGIMGLPLHETALLLSQAGISVLQEPT